MRILGALLIVSMACGGGPAKPSSTTPPAASTERPVDDDGETDEEEPTPAADEPAADPEFIVGKFVRFELITKTPDEAAAFYRETFGWKIEAAADDGDAVFTIANGDEPMGRIRRFDPARKLPLGWVSWISVEDPADVMRDVEANGGSIAEPPRRVRTETRGLVIGPTGGTFGLVRADDGDPTDRDLRAGDWYWSQLWTTNLADAVSFYEVVGGYTSVEYQFGKLRYQVMVTDNVPRAVLVQAPPKQSSRWLPFVQVDDVDALVKGAKKRKAKVITDPRNVDGIGRVAVLQAPTGGIFGVIEPATGGDSDEDEDSDD